MSDMNQHDEDLCEHTWLPEYCKGLPWEVEIIA